MYPKAAFDPSLLDSGIESLNCVHIQLSGKSQVGTTEVPSFFVVGIIILEIRTYAIMPCTCGHNVSWVLRAT